VDRAWAGAGPPLWERSGAAGTGWELGRVPTRSPVWVTGKAGPWGKPQDIRSSNLKTATGLRNGDIIAYMELNL